MYHFFRLLIIFAGNIFIYILYLFLIFILVRFSQTFFFHLFLFFPNIIVLTGVFESFAKLPFKEILFEGAPLFFQEELLFIFVPSLWVAQIFTPEMVFWSDPACPSWSCYLYFVRQRSSIFSKKSYFFLFLHKSYFYFKFILREHPSPSRSCYLYLVVKGVLDFHSGNNNGCFRIKILLTWIYWEIDYNRLILNDDDHHYVRLVWVQLVARPELFWICSHNGSLLNDDDHH